jgi:hypothetical protein
MASQFNGKGPCDVIFSVNYFEPYPSLVYRPILDTLQGSKVGQLDGTIPSLSGSKVAH